MTPTLPIDAPAPIPTVSPYPMGIASFYYPGYTIETVSPYVRPRRMEVTAKFLELPSPAWKGESELTVRPCGILSGGIEISASLTSCS